MNINKAFLCTVVVAILAGFALQSCNDDDNYGERKKKERKIISSFIKKGTTILAGDANDTLVSVNPIKVMPVKRRLELIRHAEINDHLIIEDDFENEFVYFPNTGVYMQIVRKGVGTKLQNKETATILCRFIEVNLRGDSIQASNQNSYTTAIPDVMTVSNTLGTFTGSFVSGIMYSYYGASVPSGWLVPLSYVNIGRQETPDEKIAKVRLIVPDSQGQKNASENVYACFYDITYQRGYR